MPVAWQPKHRGRPLPAPTTSRLSSVLVVSYQNQPCPPALSAWVLTITAQPTSSEPSALYISFTIDEPAGREAFPAAREASILASK